MKNGGSFHSFLLVHQRVPIFLWVFLFFGGQHLSRTARSPAAPPPLQPPFCGTHAAGGTACETSGVRKEFQSMRNSAGAKMSFHHQFHYINYTLAIFQWFNGKFKILKWRYLPYIRQFFEAYTGPR